MLLISMKSCLFLNSGQRSEVKTIPQSFIETLKMSCDIESIISSYLQLKRAGHNLTGLCPFHSEKTPSMVVYNESQSFYCFGCGAGGDVISFIMRMENLDYIEALRFLSEKAGLKMPEDGYEDNSLRIKPVILEINRLAARFFHDTLKSEAGRPGLEYFLSRGLSNKTIVKYGLGYAPSGWDNLRNFLRSKGFTDEQMLQAAVVSKGKNNSCYDMFRNRVIFPIIDLKKNVIGFGGRVLDDSKPKYLNSADTPVFKKSKNLFSLNYAKNTGENRIILAEGYMDVIAINQAGFENVVATLGTALTSEQARLISSYAKEVVIAYDSDEAGRVATNRAVSLLDEVGISTKILDMKGAKDPDEYIKKFGVQRFKMLLDGAGNVVEYQLSVIKKKYDVSIAEGQAGYLSEAVKYLSTVQSPIEREIYAGVLSKETGVLKETVLSNISSAFKRRENREKKKQWSNIQMGKDKLFDRTNPQRTAHLQIAMAEEGIIAFLYKHQDYREYVLNKISPEDFITDLNREIFSILLNKLQNNLTVTLMDFNPELSSEKLAKLSGILASYSDIQMLEKALNDYIGIILDHKDKNAMNKVDELTDEELRLLAERLREKKK